jgi:hypothetical protein
MRALVVALSLVGMVSPSLSQTMTSTTINGIRTGWNVDSFAITTVEAIANPANCPTPDGYISNKAQPGYDTYYAAALTAFISPSSSVVVTVDDTKCLDGRPKIIGINLAR